MKRCANLLRTLMYGVFLVLTKLFESRSQDKAFVFNEPVDPVKHGCPNYNEVIKQPMDLGTIKQKLDANAYQDSIEAFAEDVRLVEFTVFCDLCSFSFF